MTTYRKRTTGELALLVLILVLGWALRTHDLETRSLWADEGWTLLLSEGPGLDDVARTMAADQHPPLFFMAFRVWRGAAGETAFAARYFSVLISMLGVAAAYQLGRELFGPLAGVLAALLLALADNHIDLAQEARHYSLLATLGVVSSLYYARWWRQPTRANRAGYVLASIALLYTHYLGGMILIAQLIHMLLLARPWARLREALFLFGAACAGFLPWFPVVLDQNRLRWDNPLYYQNAVPNSMDTYRAVRDTLLGGHYGLMLALALVGLVYIAYRERGVIVGLRPAWPTLYLAIWIGLVVGLTVAINAQRQFLTERNFIVITPAIMLLAGHGLANLERTARWVLVAVIVVVGLTTVDARRHYPDWRAVTHNISADHLPGEPVLMDVWVGDFPVRYYIDRQMGDDTPRVSLREWRDRYGVQFRQALKNYLGEVEAFWLVYWGDNPQKEHGGSAQYADLLADLGFQRTLTRSVDHRGTPLYTYRYDKLTPERLATFGELFALHKVRAPATAAPGETITVALWWTALQPPDRDYSAAVFVMDEAGARVAPPADPPLPGPTSAWQPGTLHYDARDIPLPASLAPGTYRLVAQAYWYGTPDEPLPVRRAGARQDGAYVTVGQLSVE